MTDLERLEWDILRLINEARADPQKALEDRGLGAKYDPAKYPPRRPLRMNIALRGAAQEHAQRMADQETLDHIVNGVHDLASGSRALDIGPFVWRPRSPETLVLDDGHFCLFARVLSDEDPIMHEANVLEREYENNLAQLNVTVVDELGNGEDSFPINIGPGGSQVDVRIDPGQLPQDGGKVYLRLRSRFLEGAKLRGLKVSETTPGGQITTLVCKSSGPYILENLQFAKGEICEAELQLKLPAKGKEGATYPVRVTQNIDGRPVGAVTVVARYFTNPMYIGNKNTGELHLPDCQWIARMSPRNKKPLCDLDAAHKKGYDNCATCLGGSKR